MEALSYEHLGLSLTGEENQKMRYLVRRCRTSLVSIPECGIPFLNELLPAASRHRSVLHGLFALATRVQSQGRAVGLAGTSSTRMNDSTGASKIKTLDSYQVALSELRMEMAGIVATNMQDIDKIQAALASSLLLCIFGFAESSQQWTHHIDGMITVIEATNCELLGRQHLGRLVMLYCAHMDISALSVGRKRASRQAWQRWGMSLPNPFFGEISYKLSSFEIGVGYPESLISLLAMMSQNTDECVLRDHIDTEAFSRIESLLIAWEPPIVTTLSSLVNRSITIACETVRRAALIYHWRGKGFRSDYTQPIRVDRQQTTAIYAQEIIFNVQGLIQQTITNGNMIGNSMLWPVIVAGCECGFGLYDWRADIIELLESFVTHFSMVHAEHMKNLLLKLWAARAKVEGLSTEHDRPAITLEELALETGRCIPMF